MDDVEVSEMATVHKRRLNSIKQKLANHADMDDIMPDLFFSVHIGGFKKRVYFVLRSSFVNRCCIYDVDRKDWMDCGSHIKVNSWFSLPGYRNWITRTLKRSILSAKCNPIIKSAPTQSESYIEGGFAFKHKVTVVK